MPDKSAATITVQFRNLFLSKRLRMGLIYYRAGKWHNFVLVTKYRVYGVCFRRWQIGFDVMPDAT